MHWALCCTPSFIPPTYKIVMAASCCWPPCSADIPFLGDLGLRRACRSARRLARKRRRNLADTGKEALDHRAQRPVLQRDDPDGSRSSPSRAGGSLDLRPRRSHHIGRPIPYRACTPEPETLHGIASRSAKSLRFNHIARWVFRCAIVAFDEVVELGLLLHRYGQIDGRFSTAP